MGIFGNLFGVDRKPLLVNAIKEAIIHEIKCTNEFINVLEKYSLDELNNKTKYFELFQIFREIRNNHSKLIEVEGASSREMYQALVSLKAINADYDGRADIATGIISNFKISLTRTTEYGGIFVQVIASIDGFEVIDNFLEHKKTKSNEIL